MANKQDLEGAQNRNYACEYFGLVFTREGWWLVQTTSAKTGEVIDVGLDLMSEKILNILTGWFFLFNIKISLIFYKLKKFQTGFYNRKNIFKEKLLFDN